MVWSEAWVATCCESEGSPCSGLPSSGGAGSTGGLGGAAGVVRVGCGGSAFGSAPCCAAESVGAATVAASTSMPAPTVCIRPASLLIPGKATARVLKGMRT